VSHARLHKKLDFFSRPANLQIHTNINTNTHTTTNMTNSAKSNSRGTMGFIKSATTLALAALAIAPLTTAHSWIEEYQVIDTNGSYIGDRGFSRGYMARTDPGYNGFSMDYLVPATNIRINSSDLLCHPSQRSSNYSNPAYPKLKVQPGGYVAMKYLENGHVTLPWNQLGKPEAAGTVFVYGTTQPSDDEKIADVLAWTTDGKGGNGKGFLLTAQNFDDGRCHQVNCGNISTDRQMLFPAHVEGQNTSSVEQWCETDLKIPESQPLGSLTTYWVWQWPTEPNHDCTYPDGKDEYYTTCADFEIVAGGSGNGDSKIAAEADTNTLVQENPQSTAVSNFMSRHAYTTSPPVIMLSGTQTLNQKAVATAAFVSGCSAGQTAGPSVDVPASCDPVTVFTGVAVASASAAIKQLATTLPVNAPEVTADAAAAGNSAAAASLNTIPSSAPAPTSAAAPASASGTQTSTYTQTSTTTTSMTVTSVLTMSAVVTQTTYAAVGNSAAASSAPSSNVMASSAPASSIAAPSVAQASGVAAIAPSGNGIPFSTISTAIAAASTPASAAPTVGADGLVEDVVVASTNRFAEEHLAGHRRHARQFR